MGHKRPVRKGVHALRPKGLKPIFYLYFILFRMCHCVILQRVRVPSYYESSSRRINVGKAAPMIAWHPRILVWIFICIISVTNEDVSELCVKCVSPSALVYYRTLGQALGCISPLDRSAWSYFLKKMIASESVIHGALWIHKIHPGVLHD
jgi:hypothetical protein